MFSLSEILFLALLGLILIGPKQLPEVARNFARLINEMRRASSAIFGDLDPSKHTNLKHTFDLREQMKKQIIDQAKNPAPQPEQVKDQNV